MEVCECRAICFCSHDRVVLRLRFRGAVDIRTPKLQARTKIMYITNHATRTLHSTLHTTHCISNKVKVYKPGRTDYHLGGAYGGGSDGSFMACCCCCRAAWTACKPLWLFQVRPVRARALLAFGGTGRRTSGP